MRYGKINWSPFATNVLDAGEFDLCKPDGTMVKFYRPGGRGFCLELPDGTRLETDDNLQMSYWMNQNEIGGRRKAQVSDG